MSKQEMDAIPRPGTAVEYEEGTHQMHISETERARLWETFAAFDSDSNGTISTGELEAVFIALDVDIDPDMLEVVMRDYDEDESGEISFEEFVPLFTEMVEALDLKARGVRDPTLIKMHQIVYARDSLGVFKEAKVREVFEIYAEKLPLPKGVIDFEEPKPPKVERREYKVRFTGGEMLRLPRRLVWTKEELNLPQSAVDIKDIIPPSREAIPVKFQDLIAKGVPAAEMPSYISFCHRHGSAVDQWYPVLKNMSYTTEWVDLDAADVEAFIEGDWGYLHSTLCDKITPVIEGGSLDTRTGLLPRISSCVPTDHVTSSSCLLTNAWADVNEADSDVREFVTKQRRNVPLSQVVAERHGLVDQRGEPVGGNAGGHKNLGSGHGRRSSTTQAGFGHIPTKKDVEAARERATGLRDVATKLQKAVGRSRLAQFTRDTKSREDEIQELEEEKTRLIAEYENFMEIEREKLSLIDQMHAGPRQDELKDKSRKQLRYLESSLLDAKEVMNQRIQDAMDRNDEMDEGAIAMESETEGIERMVLLSMSLMQKLLSREVILRQEIFRKQAAQSAKLSRRSRIAVRERQLSEEEKADMANTIKRAVKGLWARREADTARSYWTEVRDTVRALGPSPPMEKNLVLAAGMPLFGHYVGYSLTLDIEGGQIETRIISRWTEFREATVRVPFSARPAVGGRFALQPPGSVVTIIAQLHQACMLQLQGREEKGLDSTKLRKAMSTLGVLLTDSQARRLIATHGRADSGSMGEVDEIGLSLLGNVLRDGEFKRHLRASQAELQEASGPKIAFLKSALALIDQEASAWEQVAQSNESGWKEALFRAPVWHSEFTGQAPELTQIAPESERKDEDEPESPFDPMHPSEGARRTLLMTPDEPEVKKALNLPPQLNTEVVTEDWSQGGEPEWTDQWAQDENDDFEDMPRAAALFAGGAFRGSRPGVSPVGSFVKKTSILAPNSPSRKVSSVSGAIASPLAAPGSPLSRRLGAVPVAEFSDSPLRSRGSLVPPSSGSLRVSKIHGSDQPFAEMQSLQPARAAPPPSLGALQSRLAQENDKKAQLAGGGHLLDLTGLNVSGARRRSIQTDALSPGRKSPGIRFGSVSSRPRSASYNATLGITLKDQQPEHPGGGGQGGTETVAGNDFGSRESPSAEEGVATHGGVEPLRSEKCSDTASPQPCGPLVALGPRRTAVESWVSGLSFGSGNEAETPPRRAESPSLRQTLHNSGQKLVDELRESTPVKMFGSFLSRVSGGRSESVGGRSPAVAKARQERRKGQLQKSDSSGAAGRRERRRTSLAMMGNPVNGVGGGWTGRDGEDMVDVRWAWFGVMENVPETPVVNAKPFAADFDLENLDEVRGKIAVCESGQCSLVVKARNAQNAGAVALVILCSEQEIDQEVYFNKPKPKMEARPKELHSETRVQKSLDLLHTSVRHKHEQNHIAPNKKRVGPGAAASAGPVKRKTMMGQDLAEMAASEAAAGVPEYERRSMIRIPVVLAEKFRAKGVKTGSKVTIHIFDANEEVKLNVWPYELATMDSTDADVRGNWRCVTNVILRAFHTVQLASLPIGVRPEDPEAWSLETLNESLRQMNWVPKKHREYTKEELAKLARDMKCKPPNAKTLQVFKVKVDEGQHLPMLDNTIKSSAFVSLEMNKVKRRSKTVQGSQDPLWRETFKFQMNDEDVRHSLISNAKELFDQFCNEEHVLELEALVELLKTLKVKESAKSIMARFDTDKTGNIDWAEFVIMFDALGFDKRDLILTLFDSAIAGIEKEIGKAVVSVKNLKSGETKSLTVVLLGSDGETLYGHDGRATALKIRLSMHNISSAKVFDKTGKEASRIIAGSDKVHSHFKACRLLGGEYSLKLCLSQFDPSLPENPHREFRVFVSDNIVTAITQRHGNIFFAELGDEDTRMGFFMRMMNFFYLDVQHEMRDATYQRYILDLYIVPPSVSDDIAEHCKILCVKPFHESVDAVLFSWKNLVDRSTLESGAILPYGVQQYIEMDDEQVVPNVEMRVRLEPLDDPLGSLSTLWNTSLKELVKDLGLEDPNLAGQNDAIDGTDDAALMQKAIDLRAQQKSSACSVS